MRPGTLLFLVAALGGCATQFMATAPTGAPGTVYVAGSAGGQRALWLCPVEGRDTECTQVDIEVPGEE